MNNKETNRQLPTENTIADLLPRYYETHGNGLTYSIEWSQKIEGHQVAWLRYDGVIKQDVMGLDREGESFNGHELKCVCDFTEGIGWRTDEKYGVVTISSKDCEAKYEVAKQKYAELRQNYIERGFLTGQSEITASEFEVVMMDMILKAKSGEFLESGNGAQSWGGYFYIQTLAKVLEIGEFDAFSFANVMIKDKKILLNGAIVQDYSDPPEPEWEPYMNLENNGYTVTASMPVHERMSQTWRFSVIDSFGESVEIDTPDEQMMYAPVFGPDVDDVERARAVMSQIASRALMLYEE